MSAQILRAESVSVRLGDALIIEQADLTLRAGELVVLVGPNGAGKTTLVRALAGLIPAEGRIAVDGRPLQTLAPRQRARRIAYLPQGNTFHWPLAVADVVALGRMPHGDPFVRLAETDRAAVRRALDATATGSFAARPVTTLSGGERARVALARALATEAAVLLADEPTVSLDPRHQLVVMELLRNAARAGGAVLAVLHDLPLAARFADRVAVMDRGRLIADAAPADALDRARLGTVFGIEAAMVDIGGVAVPIPRRPLEVPPDAAPKAP
jgi:iron complex transport system ATP-binding protein